MQGALAGLIAVGFSEKLENSLVLAAVIFSVMASTIAKRQFQERIKHDH